MHYCRSERRPFILEPMVSRLYGHSSSSGAPRSDDSDCIAILEERLLGAQLVDHDAIERVHAEASNEAEAAVEKAMQEPKPGIEDIEKFTYARRPVDVVYPDDYDGLP